MFGNRLIFCFPEKENQVTFKVFPSQNHVYHRDKLAFLFFSENNANTVRSIGKND